MHHLKLPLGINALFLTTFSGVTAQQPATAAAKNYAPTFVACPSSDTPLIRLTGTAAQSNQSLSQDEIAYREGRRQVTTPLWEAYLTSGTGKGTGYDVAALMANSSNLPTLALAHSGGGYRAALYGASVSQAFDIRSTASPVAGVLQLATYQSGLSGGSWFLSSAILNGYPLMSELVQGGATGSGWQLKKHLLDPDGILGVLDNVDYLDALKDDAKDKAEAGFEVSITDVWGGVWDFFDDSEGTSHGAGILFSSIQSLPIFTSFSIPFPIIVSCNQPPAGQPKAPNPGFVVPLDTTVFEYNPFEFGSYDPFLASFTPMKNMGTFLNAGKPFIPDNFKRAGDAAGDCVEGFDQASFVYGTSSSLFNAITAGALNDFSESDNKIIKAIGVALQTALGVTEVDVARYPNSFQGVNGPAGFDKSGDETLELVDGGLNGENVPIGPFLVKARGVDVIIAADASADTLEGQLPNGANWPNGTAIILSQDRVKNILPAGTASLPIFPETPDEWVSKGLNQRPTFFGCNQTAADQTVPLVVYLPNSPAAQQQFEFFTNTSTLQLKYEKEEVTSFLNSATASASSGFVEDGQADAQWPTCLACAMLERARSRQGMARSTECQTCFTKYCHDDGILAA